MSEADTPSSLYAEADDARQREQLSDSATEKITDWTYVDSSESIYQISSSSESVYQISSSESESSPVNPSNLLNFANNLQSNEGSDYNESFETPLQDSQTVIFQGKNTEAFVAKKEIPDYDVGVPSYRIMKELLVENEKSSPETQVPLQLKKTTPVKTEATEIAQADIRNTPIQAGINQNKNTILPLWYNEYVKSQQMNTKPSHIQQSLATKQNPQQVPNSMLLQNPHFQQVINSVLSQDAHFLQRPTSMFSQIPHFQQAPPSVRSQNPHSQQLPTSMFSQIPHFQQVPPAVRSQNPHLEQSPPSVLTQNLSSQQMPFSGHTQEHQLNKSILTPRRNIHSARTSQKQTPLPEMQVVKTNLMEIPQERPSSLLLQILQAPSAVFTQVQQGDQLNRSTKPKVSRTKGRSETQTNSEKAVVHLNEALKMPFHPNPISKAGTPLEKNSKSTSHIQKQGRSATATSLKRPNTEQLTTECIPAKMKIQEYSQPKIPKHATTFIPRMANVTESYSPINNQQHLPLSAECLLMLQKNGITIKNMTRLDD